MKTQIMLSRRDAAETLGLSLRTIDHLIASKELLVVRVGRRVLLSGETLEQFIRGKSSIASGARV
jgi:excisionase family DNA binding protein